MKNIIAMILVVALTGCTTGRLFGPGYSDPDMTFVILQTKSYLLNGAGFESPTEGDAYIRNVGIPKDTHCQVFAATIEPGSYKLDYFFSNYAGGRTASSTYDFNSGSPGTLGFESKPGEILYIGAFEIVDDNENDTFSFGKTEKCGSELNALVFIQKQYANNGSGALSQTVWADRIEKRLSAMQ